MDDDLRKNGNDCDPKVATTDDLAGFDRAQRFPSSIPIPSPPPILSSPVGKPLYSNSTRWNRNQPYPQCASLKEPLLKIDPQYPKVPPANDASLGGSRYLRRSPPSNDRFPQLFRAKEHEVFRPVRLQWSQSNRNQMNLPLARDCPQIRVGEPSQKTQHRQTEVRRKDEPNHETARASPCPRLRGQHQAQLQKPRRATPPQSTCWATRRCRVPRSIDEGADALQSQPWAFCTWIMVSRIVFQVCWVSSTSLGNMQPSQQMCSIPRDGASFSQ